MKRPKYRDYERRILEYLVSKTDSGECARSNLLDNCKIPKSSLTNVLTDMEKRSLVKRQESWGRTQKIIITDNGRKLFSDIVAKPVEYGLPYQIRQYLNKRVPAVKKLHPFQEDFVNRGLLSARDNVCVFAYPASGKTVLAEMGMVQTTTDGGKALYCTPYKALDWQKYQDFTQSFSQLNAKVEITDGDNPVRLGDLESADIVIGTYERIIGAVRRKERWLSNVDFLCADEITLLAEKNRGAVIDMLLTLMKYRKKNLRIMTLSGIVGNALDIAQWLDAKPVIENRPLPGIVVEENIVYRDRSQLIFWSRDGRKKTEDTDDDTVDYLVKKNLESGKTTLIFVGPRAKTQSIAEHLKRLHTRDSELARLVAEFRQSSYCENTQLTTQLCDLLEFGIAFHHAGLHKRVRRFVEKLLSEGKLRTIVATGTLSHGIDYKIDSVIIDYGSIERVHPFFCYEYINYKGRAGRPGKSVSSHTYLLCDKAEANRVFSNFFLGQPEELIPPSTLAEEETATMALAAAADGDITPTEVSRIAEHTLWALSKKGKIPRFDHVLADLCKSGFLTKNGSHYTLTELGRMTNQSNISPFDVSEVSKLGDKPSVRDLISTAARIDLVSRYRGTSARSMDPTDMLLDWIDEMPIDSIREKHRYYYDDGDILLLGEYTGIVLQKIFTFTNRNTRRVIQVLAGRLRCGVRQDIARSGFTRLAAIAREKARPLARALIKNGYRNLTQLGKANPSRLAEKLTINEAQATNIIADARRLLKKHSRLSGH